MVQQVKDLGLSLLQLGLLLRQGVSQSLAWEPPCAVGVAKKKRKRKSDATQQTQHDVYWLWQQLQHIGEEASTLGGVGEQGTIYIRRAQEVHFQMHGKSSERQ